MLDNSTNTNNSTIKTFIDTWYQNNMMDYTSQLEDTVFCNDRTYRIWGGFDKDKTNTTSTFFAFGADDRVYGYGYARPSLSCKNSNDKFTVEASNGNGELTYPVGLITADEISYAGGTTKSNSSFYLNNNINTWTLSPNPYDWFVRNFSLSSLGGLSYGDSYDSYGVRPVISLKSGTVISSGSGTATDPFIVK